MAIVDSDTVDIEHASDLFHDVGTASFNAEALFHGVGVIRLSAIQVEDVGILLECAIVDALDQQIGLTVFFGWFDQHDLLNVFMIADKN